MAVTSKALTCFDEEKQNLCVQQGTEMWRCWVDLILSKTKRKEVTVINNSSSEQRVANSRDEVYDRKADRL